MVTIPGPKYVIPLKTDPPNIMRKAEAEDLVRMLRERAERGLKKAEAEAKQKRTDQKEGTL